jgi:hypothetical protein
MLWAEGFIPRRANPIDSAFNMTTFTTLDWDAWRAAYPGMTYEQQQAFHSEIYKHHPVQQHYDPLYVMRAIEYVQPGSVVELGGWDGELAKSMLSQYSGIRLWRNVELCREAAIQGHNPYEDRYTATDMGDWYWTHEWHCDLFVASHTIEHLSVQHLNEVVAHTHAEALFLDAPLLDGPFNWRGFTGTHILECGWDGVTEICNEHGYYLEWAEDHQTNPQSGDWARACLYLRQ